MLLGHRSFSEKLRDYLIFVQRRKKIEIFSLFS